MNSQLVMRLRHFIASRRFFWCIVAFTVLEGIWIAASGRYPMAFDEDFHLGVIRLYAHHWSPFWNQQPAHANMYGAIARDPSYLYHYLMSFPYRLISAFTHNQSIQVLFLRGLNIVLFAGGLPLYRRLLEKTGAPAGLINACFAVFALIPIVSLLEAQINYDNLLLPLTALTLLLAVTCIERLRASRRIDIKLLACLLMSCLLTSLVKYAFLPIVFAIVAFVTFYIWHTYRSPAKIYTAIRIGCADVSRRMAFVLIAGIILSLGLFGQRYGVNVVKYHTPIAACSDVLSIQACSEYGPWIRDYTLSQNKINNNFSHSPVAYLHEWFYGMWLRTFFAVDGPGTQFQTRGPLSVPGISAIIFASFAAVALLICGRRLLSKYNGDAIALLTIAGVLYIGILSLQQYQSYLHTGQPVAINGRYLLPILLPMLVVGGLAVKELLRPRMHILFAAIVIVCLLWGGGVFTYILRSNDAWYWHEQIVYDVNHAVKLVLGPITPGYNKPTQYLR